MLRRLFAQVLGKSTSRPPHPLPVPGGFEAGAVVLVATVEEPVRVTPGMALYSELASLRLRTFPVALGLAESRPVYMVPPTLFAQPGAHQAMQSVDTVVVTKASTGDLIKQPHYFQGLLDWLAAARGGTRLIADFSDNYAGYNEQFSKPFLREYQTALGEHCMLTVPCEALRQELLPYARHGIQVIEDPFESLRARPPKAPGGDPVRLCWFGALGHPNMEALVQGLVDAARGLDGRAAELRFVTHETRRVLAGEVALHLQRAHPLLSTRFIPWSPEATWAAIDDCDLVLIPQEHRSPWGRVKSHNRLVEAIRGGRLAVASPIPSYVELADYAWIGEDLAEGVRWALSHPEHALRRIDAGQRHVNSRFSPERIVTKWKELLAQPAVDSTIAKRTVSDRAPVLRLNLGCGDKILPGYVNVDVAPSRAGRSPDVLCDLRELHPFESDSFDEVLAVHVVEHFWRWEVVDILREWVRVLKPGGKMVLECPNLISACEAFLRNPVDGAGPGPEGQRTMWVFYGDPSWKDPLMCHRWNYTPQSLGAIMSEAGLVNVRQEPAQYKLREPRDMRIVGEKPFA